VTIEGNAIIGGEAGAGVVLNTDATLHGTIRCNSFREGVIGLQIGTQRPNLDGFRLTLDNNAFAGQLRYGATGPLAFNLGNNWWDDPSGPATASRNPSGSGVPVGMNLVFQPWLTAPPSCAPRP
jgi:hypothetical protein